MVIHHHALPGRWWHLLVPNGPIMITPKQKDSICWQIVHSVQTYWSFHNLIPNCWVKIFLELRSTRPSLQNVYFFKNKVGNMLVIRSLTSQYCKSPDILFNHLQLFQNPWMCLYTVYYLLRAAPIILVQMTEKQWEANVLWSGKKNKYPFYLHWIYHQCLCLWRFQLVTSSPRIFTNFIKHSGV